MALASLIKCARLRGRWASLSSNVLYSASPITGRYSQATPNVTTVAGARYASPGSTSTDWSAAQNISTPCTLATALTNATAGNLVYLRGGTYSFSGLWKEAFRPSGTGTSASNRVIFEAYPGETPIIDGSGTTTSYGLVIANKSYIKVDGIHFKNFYQWGSIYASSHHNEVVRCWFYSDTGEDVTFGLRIHGTCIGGAAYNCPSTHNWIHDNVLFNLHESQTTYILNEGSDAICIGSDNDIYGDDHNTIENNFVYHAGHTCFDGYGLYTVVKNNVFHNEPWWDDDSVGKSTTLSGDIGAGDTTINVVSTAALAQEDFLWGYILIGSERISYSSRTATSFTGCVRGISGTTAASHSSGATVSPYARYRPDMYSVVAYRGKFSHRCFQITDGGERDGIYSLVEGNRFGHAGANPNNNGADGLDIAGPRNIIRFNSVYNNMGLGVMFKYAWYTSGLNAGNGGCYNKFYNNTIYKSGYGNPRYELTDDGVSTSPEALLAIRFYTDDYTVGNVIKNNLIYDSRRYALSGFEIGCGGSDPTIPPGTVIDTNWWTEDGDPKFTDPDVSDASDFEAPDLSLQASSPCLNAGTHLTLANGSGSGSVTLVVDDASYFQDGTWGSSLTWGVTLFPDWIAIGTVSNVAQVSSINYSTNTITLASAMTWADDDPVWLYKNSDGDRVLYGTAPDLGAHPYET